MGNVERGTEGLVSNAQQETRRTVKQSTLVNGKCDAIKRVKTSSEIRRLSKTLRTLEYSLKATRSLLRALKKEQTMANRLVGRRKDNSSEKVCSNLVDVETAVQDPVLALNSTFQVDGLSNKCAASTLQRDNSSFVSVAVQRQGLDNRLEDESLQASGGTM